MIVQPATVELTKIHYYNGRNTQISTISREIFDNQINNTAIIKKNIFGHKWVLKINENKRKTESKLRITIYVIVFSCIIIAVCFGLFFSLEPKFRPKITTTTDGNNNQTLTFRNSSKFVENISAAGYCGNCTKNQVCLKLTENDVPKCNDAIDRNDPTGCGGFCSVNTQFCQLLDNKNKIYQCNNLKTALRCSEDFFNCGNMCVAKRKRCDGFVDCSNGSDEINCDCDLRTHFRCGNFKSCLPKKKKCDGTVDCWDKSDEIDCNTRCNNDSIACRNGECVPKRNFCDGLFHCSDKSDEPQGCQL